MTTPRSGVVVGLSLAALASGASLADAQQILEVDYNVGRIIVDDELRAINSVVLAVDRKRAVLYVDDREDPEGVMAFSLETGEWLRTIATRTGGGPYELTQGKTGLAVAPHGGLHVAGVLRVITFDSLGVPLGHWQPRAPESKTVCDFAEAPAVPTHRGVVRQGPEGQDQGIGPNVLQGRVMATDNREEAWAIAEGIWNARIACSGNTAYVVRSYDQAPDSVFAYRLDGREGRLHVPAADERPGCRQQAWDPAGRVIRDTPCPMWNQRLYPSFDGSGNVVLLGSDARIPGAIVDPGSGCYAVIRTAEPDPALRPATMYKDSVLVLRRESGWDEVDRNERRVTVMIYGTANRVSLHPLRRVSGEPCPGIPGILGRD